MAQLHRLGAGARAFRVIAVLVALTISGRAAEPPAGKAPSLPVFIYGTVQDEAGKPVPRARVWLRGGILGQFKYQATDADEKGNFSLNLTPPAWGTLVAVAKGYSYGSRNFSVDQGQAAQRVVLAVKAPEELRLRVIDESGQPVQGAELEYVNWKGVNGDSVLLPIDLFPVAGIAKPVSDKDGMMTIGGIPNGAVCEGQVNQQNLVRRKFEGIKPGGKPVSLKMSKGHTVTIVAMNGSTQKPAPGAMFVLFARECGSIHDTADREGRASFCLPDARDVDILVMHPNLLPPQRIKLPRWSAVAGGTLEIKLYPKVQVTGRCIDEKTGKAVEGIEVGLMSRDSDSICYFGHTDADGRYEIEAPDGPVSVQALTGADRSDKRKVETDTTKTTQLPDLKLKMLPMVRGKVVGSDGKPVVSAFVMTTPFARTTSYLTDKDGRFEFRMQEHWDGVTVACYHPTKRLSISKNVMLDDLEAGKEMEIHLLEETEIRGSVVDQHGKPCTGLPVWLQAKTDQGKGFSYGNQESTFTDAKGEFRFQALLRGSKQYRVCLLERPKAMPALANWITPTEKTIVLDPITVPEEILKARPGLPPATVAPELRCRHWVNSPPQEINSLRGKVVLLAFSATWTKRMGWAEWLAEIQLAHKLYADKGLVVIGIQHHGERNEDVQAWIAKAGLTFPIGIDNANGETFDRYRVNYYPQCVLIGRDGKRIDDRWRNDNFLAAIRKAVLYGEGVDR